MSTDASAPPTLAAQPLAGSPEQAGESTLDQDVATQIVRLAPQPSGKGDPAVETCFALGWHMAELRRLEADVQPQAQPDDDPLPPIGGLSSDQKFALLVCQIEVGIKALNLNDSPSMTEMKAAQALGALGAPEAPANSAQLYLTGAARDALKKLHIALLTQLAISGFKLGKAYSVGVDISESMLGAYKACKNTPDANKELGVTFAKARVHRIVQELRDLKTSFQPHASDAVIATLDDFGKWVRSVVPDGAGKTTAQLPAPWPARG